MTSHELAIAIAIFCCLAGAALATLMLYDKLPARYHHDDTNAVVRLVANIFVVMTSLVLGLMVNSARNTFEAVDHNLHAIATEMILLDRSLRRYGPEADDTRQRLLAYVHHAKEGTRPKNDPLIIGDPTSEQLLVDVGNHLGSLKPADAEHTALWNEAREIFQKVFTLRWELVEQAEGTIPLPLLIMVVAWLMLIFGSFGYRAPRNLVVVASLLLAAGLIAGSIYLILDMEGPFDGPIQVSDVPLDRVIAEMQR